MVYSSHMEHGNWHSFLINKDEINTVFLFPRVGLYMKRRKRGCSKAWVFCDHPPSGRPSHRPFGLVLVPSSFVNMLCWGNAKDGQLGIGIDRTAMFEPRNCHVFSGRGLKEVACGGQHSTFLLHDGSVYTCGSNSCGQLGHSKPGTSPGELCPVNSIFHDLWIYRYIV